MQPHLVQLASLEHGNPLLGTTGVRHEDPTLLGIGGSQPATLPDCRWGQHTPEHVFHVWFLEKVLQLFRYFLVAWGNDRLGDANRQPANTNQQAAGRLR